MKAIISQKGQVTIPKRLRDRLGLKPGTTIEFDDNDGKLVGRKIDPASDPILKVTGILRFPEGVDAYLDETRGSGE